MVDKSRTAEISRLTDLLQRNPGSRLFVPLAEAYLHSDMLEEAIQVLSDGLKTHGNFVAARVMLGKIYLKKIQPSKAKEQFNQVIAIAPSNIPSLKGLAQIYKEEGSLEEAKIAYQTILKVDPGDKEATAALETLKGSPSAPAEQETQEAKETTEIFKDKAEPFPEASVSKTLESEGALDSTAETQEEAAINLSEAPIVLEPHENKTMAALYMTQGHYQEAADVYERLLKRDPENQESQDGLKTALTHLRNDVKTPLSKTEKIQRLQLWLDAIQREKKR